MNGYGVKVDFGDMRMSMNRHPTLYRGKYLIRRVTPSEGVSHEFYRQLYPNILRDINVSS